MGKTRIVKGIAQKDWHPNSPQNPEVALEDLSNRLNSGPYQLQRNEHVVHIEYVEYSNSCAYIALVERNDDLDCLLDLYNHALGVFGHEEDQIM